MTKSLKASPSLGFDLADDLPPEPRKVGQKAPKSTPTMGFVAKAIKLQKVEHTERPSRSKTPGPAVLDKGTRTPPPALAPSRSGKSPAKSMKSPRKATPIRKSESKSKMKAMKKSTPAPVPDPKADRSSRSKSPMARPMP